MSEQACPVYGGQAVIEGVMFAGQHVNVTAVRRKNNEITFYEVPKAKPGPWSFLRKIPFIRGIVGIVDASAKGSQHLNYAIESYAEDHSEPGEKKKPETMGSRLSLILGVAVVGILSFIVGKLIFTLVPVFVENMLFSSFFTNQVAHTLIEGVIKIILLVVYIQLIARTPLIKRLFQYHGAEHKVISAFEAGEELTVRNVQKYNTLHYRCGSSFMILSVIIGVVIYSFFHYDTIWERVGQRILLLPLVIGVSYEALRFTNSVRDIPLLKWLGVPGLLLQKLTTKEPADDQVEVAIASFQHMLEVDRKVQHV